MEADRPPATLLIDVIQNKQCLSYTIIRQKYPVCTAQHMENNIVKITTKIDGI